MSPSGVTQEFMTLWLAVTPGGLSQFLLCGSAGQLHTELDLSQGSSGLGPGALSLRHPSAMAARVGA